LFCNHEKAITVKLDKKAGVGNLHCKVCGQRFQTGINYLSHAVDVYSDWVDACEDVAQEAAAAETQDRRGSSHGRPAPTRRIDDDDDDDEDEELEGEKDYEDE
jgi:transcription elongation factor Elf1